MKRADDFEQRRKHIANLSDQELYEKFWEVTDKVIDPLLELGRKNTTPSIERAVLLRMGVSSLICQPIVEGCMDRGLMGKGAGHVVYVVSKEKDIPIPQAAEELADGKHWDFVVDYFKKRKGGK